MIRTGGSVSHCHDDDRPTIGCEACITARRAAEEAARWEQAPLRQVIVECCSCGDWRDIGLELPVPADYEPRDKWELLDRYAQAIDARARAVYGHDVIHEWGVEVERVTVGPIIAKPEPPDPYAGMTPLFEEAT